MKKIFATILFLIIFTFLQGIESDSLKSKNSKEFLLLPFGYYTNETSVALGIFSLYKTNPQDQIFGNIIYTFKNQLMFFLITDKKFNDIIFYNYFKIKNYYSEFYGIGNNTSLDDKKSYKFFQIDNYTELGEKVLNNSNLSIAFNNFFHRPKNDDDISSIVYKEENQFTNGLGVSYKYSDVTEKLFRDGIYLKSSYLYYPEYFGNIESFSIFETELGLYKSINRSALNTLFSSSFSFGEVHPEKFSSIGGSKILRGYPERRFIDKNMLAVQTQYDIRLYKDILACIFISVGDVFKEFSDLSILNTKFAYGGGLMYEFKGLIMRCEAATSLENELSIIITGNRVF